MFGDKSMNSDSNEELASQIMEAEFELEVQERE